MEILNQCQLHQSNPGETSSGYFLHDIQPHRIPWPLDGRGESTDYDPDIYIEGTFLDIREDEGDGIHVKSFVSFSDDEGEKRKRRGDQSISFGSVQLRKENAIKTMLN